VAIKLLSPELGCSADLLRRIGLNAHGSISSVIPRLGFVGLERQRSFASATLRGVERNATHLLTNLTS
jgi:hypothetical protein